MNDLAVRNSIGFSGRGRLTLAAIRSMRAPASRKHLAVHVRAAWPTDAGHDRPHCGEGGQICEIWVSNVQPHMLRHATGHALALAMTILEPVMAAACAERLRSVTAPPKRARSALGWQPWASACGSLRPMVIVTAEGPRSARILEKQSGNRRAAMAVYQPARPGAASHPSRWEASLPRDVGRISTRHPVAVAFVRGRRLDAALASRRWWPNQRMDPARHQLRRGGRRETSVDGDV